MEKLLNGKNAQEVAKTVSKLLMPHKKTVKSITADNGSEFAKHHLISNTFENQSVFYRSLFFMAERKYRKCE